MTLQLATRNGWPDDLRILLTQYPRETWQGHANLGEMVRFWLSRHDMFRKLGAALDAVTVELREGRIAPAEFQAWFAPRLQFFLSQLEAHHQVEDHHYFPILRAAETRLVRGFDVLENDHEAIHAEIVAAVEGANALLRALGGDRDTLPRAADDYAAVSTRLIGGLMRHLGDEEDLIVPLILDRGEQALGVHG